MDRLRVAPTVGIVASVALVVALSLPYLLGVDGTGGYYGSGSVNPLLAGLFALVTVIVFAAGREERSDPQLAAGVALALGVFAVVVTVVWALTARVDAVQLTSSHRWAVVGAAALVPLSAGWYARTLGVL